jgi:multidrug transporter EmrE-like cation transporter
MPLFLFLLILASVGLSAVAQLVLKLGVGAAATAGPRSVAGEMAALAQSPLVVAGLGLYGIGALMWLFVLARAPLSLAYPFVGLGFVLTMLAGALCLGEDVTPARMAGTLLIAFGCVMVARSA